MLTNIETYKRNFMKLTTNNNNQWWLTRYQIYRRYSHHNKTSVRISTSSWTARRWNSNLTVKWLILSRMSSKLLWRLKRNTKREGTCFLSSLKTWKMKSGNGCNSFIQAEISRSSLEHVLQGIPILESTTEGGTLVMKVKLLMRSREWAMQEGKGSTMRISKEIAWYSPRAATIDCLYQEWCSKKIPSTPAQ